jgi:4-hydroxybenzoate polyprenyltransferase
MKLRILLQKLCACLSRQWPRYVASFQWYASLARPYVSLTRLNRPIGIFLLLWPTWWALVIAGQGHPDRWLWFAFTIGVVVMRSAGCVINDYADRHIDSHVRRTRERPLVTGAVTPREAMTLFYSLVGLAVLLVLTLNRLTQWLAVAALLLAITYPLAKRHTYLAQFHLGLAFGWSVPMAFAAQTNTLPPLAWLLLIANILWSVVYDTMYAMADREDDLKIGVRSTAILFAENDRVIIGIIQVMLLATFFFIGQRADLGLYYYLGLAAATLLGIYHQYLIRDRDPDDCLRAFRHNNWLGLCVFLGLLLDYRFG